MAEAANLASTYIGRMRPKHSGVKMEEVKKHPKGTSIGLAAPTMTTKVAIAVRPSSSSGSKKTRLRELGH